MITDEMRKTVYVDITDDVFTVRYQKKVLPLSPLGADFAGTDRLAGIPIEQYEAVKNMLLEQVRNGLFDEVIKEAHQAL